MRLPSHFSRNVQPHMLLNTCSHRVYSSCSPEQLLSTDFGSSPVMDHAGRDLQSQHHRGETKDSKIQVGRKP